jgi:hypothetical protein
MIALTGIGCSLPIFRQIGLRGVGVPVSPRTAISFCGGPSRVFYNDSEESSIPGTRCPASSEDGRKCSEGTVTTERKPPGPKSRARVAMIWTNRMTRSRIAAT